MVDYAYVKIWGTLVGVVAWNAQRNLADSLPDKYGNQLIEKWRLAPAYDICYSHDPNNIWVNQQPLSVNGKHKNITKEDLLTIAQANNIKNGNSIIEEINQAVKQWEDFAAKVKVKQELRDDIQANLHFFK